MNAEFKRMRQVCCHVFMKVQTSQLESKPGREKTIV